MRQELTFLRSKVLELFKGRFRSQPDSSALIADLELKILKIKLQKGRKRQYTLAL